jgi:hypothetical protein
LLLLGVLLLLVPPLLVLLLILLVLLDLSQQTQSPTWSIESPCLLYDAHLLKAIYV